MLISEIISNIRSACSNTSSVSDEYIINIMGDYLINRFNHDIQPMRLLLPVTIYDFTFKRLKYDYQLRNARNIPAFQKLDLPIKYYLGRTVHEFTRFEFNRQLVTHTTRDSDFLASNGYLTLVNEYQWLSTSPYTYVDDDRLNAFYIKVVATDKATGIKHVIEVHKAEETGTYSTDKLNLLVDFENKKLVLTSVASSNEIYSVTIVTVGEIYPTILTTADNKIYTSYTLRPTDVTPVIVEARLNPQLPYGVNDILDDCLQEFVDAIIFGCAYLIQMRKDGSPDDNVMTNYQAIVKDYNTKVAQKRIAEMYSNREQNNINVNQVFSSGRFYAGRGYGQF